MYPNAHGKTTYNSQDMKATEISINGGMDKKIWYIYMMGYYYLAIKKKECYLQQHGCT